MMLWIQLLICLVVIGYAGYFLSRYGDIIAEKTGMSASWVGLILLSTATSLPELVTGISAVTVAMRPILPLVTYWAAPCSIWRFWCCWMRFISAKHFIAVPPRDTFCRLRWALY